MTEKTWLNEANDEGYSYAIAPNQLLHQRQSRRLHNELHGTISSGRLLRIDSSFMAGKKINFFYGIWCTSPNAPTQRQDQP